MSDMRGNVVMNANDVEQIAKLATTAAGLKLVEMARDGHGKIPVALVPDGYTVQSMVSMVPPMPDRIRAATTHNSVSSFCEYVNRYKQPNSVVFASVLASPYEFLAILDYHGPMADWGTHTAKLVLTETDEWKVWAGSNGKLFNQAEFALFIEDHLNDVTNPDGGTMLELALNLSATQECGFKGKLNLQNGDVGLVVDQKTDAVALGKNGEIAIPKELTLQIAPFRGIPQRPLQARFRYTLRPPHLSLGYQMIRPNAFIDEVVGAAYDMIKIETELPVFSGSFKSMV